MVYVWLRWSSISLTAVCSIKETFVLCVCPHMSIYICHVCSHKTVCRDFNAVSLSLSGQVSKNWSNSFEKCFMQQEQLGGETTTEKERHSSNDDGFCFISNYTTIFPWYPGAFNSTSVGRRGERMAQSINDWGLNKFIKILLDSTLYLFRVLLCVCFAWLKSIFY